MIFTGIDARMWCYFRALCSAAINILDSCNFTIHQLDNEQGNDCNKHFYCTISVSSRWQSSNSMLAIVDAFPTFYSPCQQSIMIRSMWYMLQLLFTAYGVSNLCITVAAKVPAWCYEPITDPNGLCRSAANVVGILRNWDPMCWLKSQKSSCGVS